MLVACTQQHFEQHIILSTTLTESAPAACLPQGAPGLSFGKLEEKMGWRSQPTAAVNLDAVRVPASSLVGHEGQGFKIAMAARGWPGAALAWHVWGFTQCEAGHTSALGADACAWHSRCACKLQWQLVQDCVSSAPAMLAVQALSSVL